MLTLRQAAAAHGEHDGRGAGSATSEAAAVGPAHQYMRHRFALQCFAQGLFPRLQSLWGRSGGSGNNQESGTDTDDDSHPHRRPWSCQVLYNNQLHVYADTHAHGEGAEHVLVVQRSAEVGTVGAARGVSQHGLELDITGSVAVDVIAWCVLRGGGGGGVIAWDPIVRAACFVRSL